MLQVLEVLLRMRQAACHLGLLPGKTVASSSKLDLLLETLEEIVSEGHKALVFSQWTSMLDLVEPALRAAKIGYTRLDGSTIDRAKVVSEFSADDGPPVFLLSLKAGGTGLNLTAADYVFHLDPWWNPAVEDQATDRAHRIGQDRPVVSCRLIAEDTVEERILELQERKRGIARAALDEEALAKGITRDELMALFE
jgi:SNF2 family DNA or RNA helicase